MKLSRNRSFWLLFFGQAVTNFGSSLHAVAIMWYIMKLVGEAKSASYLAQISLCMVIPLLILSPIAGVFIDRINRKAIIVGTDLIRGLLTLLLGILFVFDLATIPIIYIIVVLLSGFGTFFNPAVNAILPNVIEKENLMRANSILGLSKKVSTMLGAAMAGILYGFIGIAGLMIVDGITYILSGISEMFILYKAKQNKNGSLSVKVFFKEFAEGLAYLKTQKLALILLGYMILINFVTNPLVKIVLPKTLTFGLAVTEQQFGIFQSMSAVGAILGFLILSMLPKRESYYKIMVGNSFLNNLVVILFGVMIIPTIASGLGPFIVYISYCILFVFLIITAVLIDVPIMTHFQKNVPDEYRGRFFGTTETIAQAIIPIGLIVYGVIADKVDEVYIFIISGIVCLMATLAVMFRKDVKQI